MGYKHYQIGLGEQTLDNIIKGDKILIPFLKKSTRPILILGTRVIKFTNDNIYIKCKRFCNKYNV